MDRQANMAYGEGDVVLKYQGMTLRADKARYNMATDEVWAEGNVRLNRDGQEWVMPAAYYNMKTRALKAETARGVFDAAVLRADNIRSTGSNQYSFARATVSTCDYEEPHYRLQATRGVIYPGERVVLYGVTFRLGDVPVFWLPALGWSLKGENDPVAIEVGQSSREGFFILTRTRVSLTRNIRATVHLDGRTDRGPGVGGDLDYYYSPKMYGKVCGYYAMDSDPMDDVDRLLGRTIPENRYRLDWQHKQELQGDVDITVNLTKQSDSDLMDDFFQDRYHEEGEPASVVDVTKRGENYTLSLLAQPQLNRYFAEVQRLPEARWAVNRTRILSTPLFYEADSSAGYYRNHAGRTGDPVFDGRTPRADTFHQLVLPQHYFGWLSIVPRAGMRGAYYLDAPIGAPDTNEIRLVVFNAGVESSFKLSRTWDGVESKRLDIHGLRHIFEPFVDYQWIPTPNVTCDEVFQFDTYRYATLGNGSRLLTTRYLPLDFPANTAIDAIERQNVARFGIRQKLQTQRDSRGTSSRWRRGQTTISRTRPTRRISPISSRPCVSPWCAGCPWMPGCVTTLTRGICGN